VTAQSPHEPAQEGQGAEQAEASLGALGRGMLDDVVAVLRERLRLLALEGQQFVLAAGQLLTLGVIAAVFILTAWFVLVGGVIAALVLAGVPLAAALAGGVVVNLMAALAAWLAMRRLLDLMLFPASARALRLEPAARPDMPNLMGDSGTQESAYAHAVADAPPGKP